MDNMELTQFREANWDNSLTKCIHLMFYVTTLFFLEIFHSRLPGVKLVTLLHAFSLFYIILLCHASH